MDRTRNTEIGHTKESVIETPARSRRFSLGKLSTFSSLQNGVFALYFAGMFTQSAASMTQMMLRSLLVYRLTGSAAILGTVALAGTIPHVLSSLYGGAIADRIQKKYILLVGQGAFAVVALGIALSLTFGFLNAKTWWILAIDSILYFSFIGLQIPARHAIIREIVGREKLMNAISLNTMGTNAWRLMSPAASGFLIDAFGFAAVYFIMAGIYALSAIFIAFIPRTSEISADAKNKSALKATIEGFKYIRNEPNILAIIIFCLFIVVLAMPYQQVMPLFTEGILKVGAKGLGILTSVSGVGAIAGALVLASLPDKKRGLMFLLGTLILAFALIGFSFSKSWILSLAMMFVVGVGQTARMTLSNTLAQHYTTDQYRGRVMGIYDMEISFHLTGVWIVGIMSEAIGAPWALGSLSMVLALVCIATLLFTRRLKSME